jgi:hypothetical protein
MSRRLVLPLLAALAVLLAGCGGSEKTAASGTADVAAIVPADVPLLLAFETDPESEQWRQAEQLLDRFPGKDRLVAELSRELSEEGLSIEGDVLPALGDDTFLAFLDLDDEPEVVLITKPRDPQKLEQLLRESDEPAQTRVVEGWTLVAESDEVLDRFGEEGDRLDGSDWFADAQERVEDAALVTVYANGPALMEASAASLPRGCEPPEPAGRLDFAVGTLVAQEDGARLLFQAAGDGAAELVGDETLLAHVPPRALAYLGAPSFAAAGLGLSGQLRCALDQADAPDAERLLGVSYDDIVDLFAGGFAFYVGPGLLVPEFTLVLEPEDEARALETLDELAGTVSRFFGAEKGERRVGEVDARELQLGPVSILYGAGDGRVVVTSAPAGFDALAGDGESLEDDERFRDAREAAGAGDDAQIYAYLDLDGLVDLLDTVSAFSEDDVPPEVQANLEPLESFVAWGDVSDPDEPELGLVLEIR